MEGQAWSAPSVLGDEGPVGLGRLFRSSWAVVIALQLFCSGSASALDAQSRSTSAVRGSVLGPNSAEVAGAVVHLRHEQTGVERTTLTNERGNFLLLLVAPGGPYTLSIQHLGMAEGLREGILLQVGETFIADFGMQLQVVELEAISVEVDRSAVFNPSQVGPVTRLDTRTIEAMPLLSRDITELNLLSPLVTATEGGGFSVAGVNDRYNALLIDGIVGKDMFGLTSGGVPGGQAGAKLIPLDAVSQYEILIAPFDVRLSGFTGGVMNAVTRTGTNEWRIRAAGVHRAEALMGDLITPTGPVEASGVDRSLVALSVGGPIVRDRGHFFVAGEFEERKQLPAGFNLFRDDPSLIRISPESFESFRSQWESKFGGLETGLARVYPLGQELANLFARIDWDLGGGSRLTVRNVFAQATNDERDFPSGLTRGLAPSRDAPRSDRPRDGLRRGWGPGSSRSSGSGPHPLPRFGELRRGRQERPLRSPPRYRRHLRHYRQSCRVRSQFA